MSESDPALEEQGMKDPWTPRSFEDREQDAVRVAIHHIERNIVAGLYDADLTTIAEAVRLRQQKRKDDVLALVREVYGENAEIQITRSKDYATLPGGVRGVTYQ